MADNIKRPNYMEYQGRYFPPTSPEWFDYLVNKFTPRDSDIILATYPRSGTTWLQSILYMLKHKHKIDGPIQTSIPFIIFPQFDSSPGPGSQPPLKPEFENIPAPRILKTHLPWDLVPKSPHCKYVYCYRNPKDVLVSFHLHTTGSVGHAYDGSLSEFLDLFLRGEVEYGSWWQHVLGWWQLRDNPNVLVLSYEELQSNFKEKVSQLAAFTGLELTEELYELIAKESALKAMKSNEFISLKMKPVKPGEQFAHVRKGVVGDWKEVLTAEQNKAIDDMIALRLKDSSLRDKLVFEL